MQLLIFRDFMEPQAFFSGDIMAIALSSLEDETVMPNREKSGNSW